MTSLLLAALWCPHLCFSAKEMQPLIERSNTHETSTIVAQGSINLNRNKRSEGKTKVEKIEPVLNIIDEKLRGATSRFYSRTVRQRRGQNPGINYIGRFDKQTNVRSKEINVEHNEYNDNESPKGINRKITEKKELTKRNINGHRDTSRSTEISSDENNSIEIDDESIDSLEELFSDEKNTVEELFSDEINSVEVDDESSTSLEDKRDDMSDEHSSRSKEDSDETSQIIRIEPKRFVPSEDFDEQSDELNSKSKEDNSDEIVQNLVVEPTSVESSIESDEVQECVPLIQTVFSQVLVPTVTTQTVFNQVSARTVTQAVTQTVFSQVPAPTVTLSVNQTVFSQVIVPTVMRFTSTMILPTTVHKTATQFNRVTEVRLLTLTELQTEVQTITDLQTELRTVTDLQTVHNTVTDVTLLTETETETEVATETVSEYHTVAHTHTQHLTHTETQTDSVYLTHTQHLTHTYTQVDSVYLTHTETATERSYYTQQVPVVSTEHHTQLRRITTVLTHRVPAYTTVLSKEVHRKYITVTARPDCHRSSNHNW